MRAAFKSKILLWSALWLITSAVAYAAGTVYRWVDDDGVVHFGHIVPEGVEATPVGIRPNTVQIQRSSAPARGGDTPEAATDGSEPQLSAAERSRQARAERREKAREEATKLAAECAVMRAQKAFLEPSTRVMVESEDGSIRRLDDAERLEGLAEADAFLAANCND